MFCTFLHEKYTHHTPQIHKNHQIHHYTNRHPKAKEKFDNFSLEKTNNI